ncbi:MAG: branched-chain amino acid ABC transporter permease [Candidatus Nanopelagicales bacterium]|jgi:branched-chain amino acid transport system permease protein|nr:branched-chain amino acid ABC transporter permease [Candidatus Nanopelagicales bacterium]MDP4825347.1 branched-chain amino acid ABC transporter permease [Candidatus Nanopelagicales bacterium]MDP4887653.1 branched-chain amino acid ABC transporter permease [Candidatus Nanopelagicales bacterium]
MSNDTAKSKRTTHGRPRLFSSYSGEMAIFNTRVKLIWAILGGAAVLALPFFFQRDMVALFTTVFIYAIGGIGLNLLTGYAGQVSLGQAFFLGIGAYTAAVLGGESKGDVIGLGWDMAIWLPLAGLVPAIIALILAPLAARVRGLYLAILTLGLVFIGEHIFKEAKPLTGGAGVGRTPAEPVLFGFDLFSNHEILGVDVDRFTVYYFACFIIFVVLALLARNFTRSRFGRSFAAVRDRDVAAEVMGVSLLRTKSLAFAVSAFYAGIAGALLSVIIGRISPETWNFFLSIDFLAVIFIGGLATITGSIMGAIFVVMLPQLVKALTGVLPIDQGVGQGGLLNVFELQTIIFGVLIVVFLIAEPRGIYGLWIRLRNYFKAWPFSY